MEKSQKDWFPVFTDAGKGLRNNIDDVVGHFPAFLYNHLDHRLLFYSVVCGFESCPRSIPSNGGVLCERLTSCDNLEDGAFYFFFFDGKIHLRRYHYINKRVFSLESESPFHENFDVQRDNRRVFRCLAKVVCSVRSL